MKSGVVAHLYRRRDQEAAGKKVEMIHLGSVPGVRRDQDEWAIRV
jgi:hypothetical protein